MVTARTTYRLPYFWSHMRLANEAATYSYTCRRRWPGPTGASSTVRVKVGEAYQPGELTEFDHYLTARWRLYSARRTGLRYALAQHDPWPLHRAEVLDFDDELITAAGLPSPQGDPIVHWSPGTEVRIGFPHKIPTSSGDHSGPARPVDRRELRPWRPWGAGLRGGWPGR